MAKLFITGATGFVGSHVARLALQQGHQVRILRRSSSRLDAIADLNVEHVIGDLFDVSALTEQLAGIDYVLHIAAVADYWRQGEASIYRANVDGTRNLLLAAHTAGVQRFIFTSSAAAIGYVGGGHAADESSYFNISPKLSPYGHSKFLAEAEVYQAIQRGLDCVILNPAVILGPGDLNQISGSIILELKRGTLLAMPQSGGTNFIDARDVAQTHLAALEKGRTGERYIVGAVNMTHKAMLKLTAEVIGVREPWLPAFGWMIPLAALAVDAGRALGLPIPAEGNQLRLSAKDLYFNPQKMWSELHTPTIDLRQSIQDTYQWYVANGFI
jgi:dihydroflavonol-4-reductase